MTTPVTTHSAEQHPEAGVSVRLTPGDHLPAAARRFVRATLEDLGIAVPPDTDLLTSEATANAVEHTTSEVIEVTVERLGPVVRISVQDDEPASPVVRPADPGEPGGLGLRLIDHLSADWGVVEIRDDGKRVWFEIPIDPA